jgi:hypothetical protein
MAGRDRAELTRLGEALLEALAARDPARLPLAPGARYTEDGQDLDFGDGFWGTADAVGGYRNLFVDAETGQAGGFAVMRENGAPVILTFRLKAGPAGIGEIEAVVTRRAAELGSMNEGPDLLEARGGPDPRWAEPVPPGRRAAREALIASADRYFQALEKNDGRKDYSFFAEDCLRWESGLLTTLNRELRYGEGVGEGRGDDILAGFAAKPAREQFELGYFAFVDRIRRRFPIVDAERGVVFAMGFFDHSGTVHRIPLTDGRVVEAGLRQPFTWQIGEAFKVEDGRLTRIEAVMKRCPYGMRSGWD